MDRKIKLAISHLTTTREHLTNKECYGAAFLCETEGEAREFLRALIIYHQKMFNTKVVEAFEKQRENLNFYATFHAPDQEKKVVALFKLEDVDYKYENYAAEAMDEFDGLIGRFDKNNPGTPGTGGIITP